MVRKIFIGLLFILGLLLICSEVVEPFEQWIGIITYKLITIIAGLFFIFIAVDEYKRLKQKEQDFMDSIDDRLYSDDINYYKSDGDKEHKV